MQGHVCSCGFVCGLFRIVVGGARMRVVVVAVCSSVDSFVICVVLFVILCKMMCLTMCLCVTICPTIVWLCFIHHLRVVCMSMLAV